MEVIKSIITQKYKECRLCGEKFKLRSNSTCNSCLEKGRKEKNKKYCSGCRKEITDSEMKFKTCEKCRERSRKNKAKNNSVKIGDIKMKSEIIPHLSDLIDGSEVLTKNELKEKLYKKLESDDLKEHKYGINEGYLAGMWDGDGSIILCDNVLSLSLSQAYPDLLIKIKNEFGGKIYKGKSKDNHKQIYGYRICGKECIPLLKILEKNCIIKYNQTKLAMKFIQYIDVDGTSDLKKKLCDKNCELNKHNHDLEKPYKRVCDSYIAGLFDAEGCIAVKNKSMTINYIKITQTNDVQILYMIKEYFDFGDVCR
jgi:hypothetical protein